MKSSFALTALLLAACMFLTACGGTSGGTSRTVSESAVSGSVITEHTIPTEMKAKTPYGSYDDSVNAIFKIKESNSQEYRAEVSLITESDEIHLPEINWELCLDMADEIKEISGAAIISHEGTLYTIRGTAPIQSLDEEGVEYKISFEITVAYQDRVHEPRFCFLSKELSYLPKKYFDCTFTKLKKDGDTVIGEIRLTNRSGEKITGWELDICVNFQITSFDGDYASYELFENLSSKKNEDNLWQMRICATGDNLDLEAGETKVISFTGTTSASKPKMRWDFTLYEQCDVPDNYTWDILESNYGSSYGKMDKYLVANTAFGTDLFFVFDEKKSDSYTATAELTNVTSYGFAGSDDIYDRLENFYDKGQGIADWEIYLECEDNIESITGAKILSHEGNIYHIGAAAPDQWISPFSFTTFQVKVSCPNGIHPLGKTYLKRAKVRNEGEDSNLNSDVTEQEFTVDEKALKNAVSALWLSYYTLYDSWFDSDDWDDETEFYNEYESFLDRQKWGKQMGRMPG